MARALEDVVKSLDPYYSGSKQIVQSQLDALPGETNAAIGQADAKLEVANDNILAGARRRGMGFSGIPLGEQAKYAATEYAPAIANLKSSQNTKQLSLSEQLNAMAREQRSQAQGIVDNELARDLQERQFQEQIRQFNENLAAQERQAAAARAAAATPMPNIGAYLGGGGAEAGAKGAARMAQGKDGGFGFFDASGRPINALQYSQMTGANYRQLLSQMAKAGDKNASVALKYVGNDGKFWNAPSAVAGALSALGASGNFQKAASSAGGSNRLVNTMPAGMRL